MTMLTVKQPPPYGYKAVYDLPTPPSTSRPSPPLTFQESQKTLSSIPRSHSPSTQQHMSGPHRGLPPPAAMTLPPQPPPSSGPPPPIQPPGHSQAPPPPAPPPIHSHHGGHTSLAALPPPPQWQGSEDAMRSWLAAKTEEDRRKQEEEKSRQEQEKTRQEQLRLEQRRVESQILQSSLGQVPGPMIPLIFLGMGGHQLSAQGWEIAQSLLGTHLPPGHQPAQLLPPPGTVSPERRRDSQGQVYGPQYGGVPSTPGTGAPGPSGGYQYPPPSPTRGRGHTISGAGPPRPHGPGSSLANLNTNVPPPGPQHGFGPSHPPSGVPQQEAQGSPLFIHHWQPPATQGEGGSNQPATPSVGEPPRKRKATSLQQQGQAPPQQRLKSPPFGTHGAGVPGGLGHPPRGPRRGHQRQQSDLSSYSYRRAQPESISSGRGNSPAQFSASGPTGREGDGRDFESQNPPHHHQQQQQQQQQPAPRSGGGHSVESLLSSEPSRTPQYTPTSATPRFPPPPQSEKSDYLSEDQARRGPGVDDRRDQKGPGH